MADTLLELLQWPAMLATLVAAWLVGAQSKPRRRVGFWIFLLSNALWVTWGWHANAHALIIMQFGLTAMNLRGAHKNE